MRNGTLHVLFGFFAALFVASQVNIIAGLGSIGGKLIQLQTTLSAETFRSILEGWDHEELLRYRTHFAWDSVHPLIYGGLLVLWILVLHGHRPFTPRGLRVLLTLAVIPSVLDYVENAFHLYLEANRGAINSVTVLLAGLAADAKWLIAAVLVVVLLLASVRAILFRPRPTPAVAVGPTTPALTPAPAGGNHADLSGDKDRNPDRDFDKDFDEI